MAEPGTPAFTIESRVTLPSGAVRVRAHVEGGRVVSLTVPARLTAEEDLMTSVRHAVATLPPAVDPRAL